MSGAALGLLLDRFPGSEVTAGADLGTAAVEYAAAGWQVFPLAPASKIPLLQCPITRAHKAKDPDTKWRCPGDCGNDGHGVKDATLDTTKVAAWWTRHPNANIGARVPAAAFVLDIDPRTGGDLRLAELEASHEPLPQETLTARSGRGDGGNHRYHAHPGGRIAGTLGPGLDIKTSKGFVVLPPSLHGTTRRPYVWEDPGAMIVDPPAWLVELLRPPERPAAVRRLFKPRPYTGDSVIAWFNAAHGIDGLLAPHGWKATSKGWLHPAATSELSATERDGSLYVYSPNTAFQPTSASDPHGYDPFAVWTVLDHHGDFKGALTAAHRLRGDPAPDDRSWVKVSSR